MPTQLPSPAVVAASSATSVAMRYQEDFHQRWPLLHDRHVRALVWLLEAPDLLDPAALRWQGRIATLGPLSEMDITWLQALDANPRDLYMLINDQPSARLGRYAEKLMTFYLQQTGRLMAHNVQVHNGANGPNETIGEFDFLVHDRHGTGAEHWEFATKFYLLESLKERAGMDAFVGPNLADSLGAKMDKIMQQQLQLSQHPAAAQYLPKPVTLALALVKGWLFYREPEAAAALPPVLGVSPRHCRGFWCELGDLDLAQSEYYLLLPRLEWLAPARATMERVLSAVQLRDAVARVLQETQAPVMIASCRESPWEPGVVLEQQRGFIVPDDWRWQAAQRVRQALVNY
jgi:hypothetical protein